MMSIRLRFTLLYNAILAVTLLIFGATLYSIQAQSTLNALKKDLLRSSERMVSSLERSVGAGKDGPPDLEGPPQGDGKPVPFQKFSAAQEFQSLPEREIVRVLNASGALVASPSGRSEDALPLSAEGLQTLQGQTDWWETAESDGQRVLIYNIPVVFDGAVAYIVQVARSLTERDNSLNSLGITLLAASLVVLVLAFGIGWMLSGVTLAPIQRITKTARAIGEERDFTHRVTHRGPQDEVGQLATTFNEMLARLQEAYQRVAQALELQRNFVADVSHELRTPLTTLRGNLGLLRRTPPVPPEVQADILADMVDESDRLIRLVNDLLVLARADAGRSLARETLELPGLLEECCRQAGQLDPARAISLEAAAELRARGDRDALKQVLLILLDNAVKHSGGEIRVSAAASGAEVEIQVADSGSGISPEELAHVFDRFYRGEAASHSQGMGLGLAIAKTLVEGQGGSIAMHSELGSGSTVTLRLPGA